MKNKFNLLTLFTLLLSSQLYFAQNTLPSTGNVGIGTTTPTKQLEVMGETQLGTVTITDSLTIDKNVNIKDSLRVQKKLLVDQDVKIIGKTVMVDNVRAKSNLTVLGNTKTKGNEIVEGNTKILGTTKMMGNGFVEGTFKFKGLADLSLTENRFLMIRPNGKAESFTKSGILNLLYSEPCKYELGTASPIWVSTPGILWTGDVCAPAKVGIGTNNPQAELNVIGGGLFNGSLSIGNLNPVNPAKLRLYSPSSSQAAFHIDAPNVGSYQYVQRISVPDGTAKAIAVHNNSHGDSFQVLANGRTSIYLTDPNYGFIIYNQTQNNEKVFEVLKNGTVYAHELNIQLTPFPDYVFKGSYNLLAIKEVDNYIKANGHLPNIPSAEEVDECGIGVGELQIKLLEKVEELTLYIIQLEKRIDQLGKTKN